ncbi:hypothetical protein SRHO_G00129920 [Serrasalmus rhombeus]
MTTKSMRRYVETLDAESSTSRSSIDGLEFRGLLSAILSLRKRSLKVAQKEEAETELKRCAMAVFVIREDEDPLQPAHDIWIGIEVVVKVALRWTGDLSRKEINAEFQRLMAIHLEEKFMAQSDMHSSELIKVIRTKGGATCQKTTDIMDTLDKTADIHVRRECVLKALIFFLGENADDLIKEYTDSDYAQRDLEQLTMAVLAIRGEGEGLREPPEDIGIVIEGVEVLHELTSVASACALLLGLIYVLNLAYPKPLRFTFEVLQKIIMQLDQHKMSIKVQNLYGRLQSLH